MAQIYDIQVIDSSANLPKTPVYFSISGDGFNQGIFLTREQAKKLAQDFAAITEDMDLV